MSAKPILSLETQQTLTAANINFLDGASEGWIRIPRAVYSGFNKEEYWDRWVEFTKELDSIHAVQFCGFEENAAMEILRRYREHDAEDPDGLDLFAFMIWYIEGLPEDQDAWDVEHDWDAALKAMGIAAEARDGILDPDFIDIRMTQTAKKWAKQTVTERIRTLEKIDGKIEDNRDWIIWHEQQRLPGVTVQTT